MPTPDAQEEDDGIILSVVLTPSQVRLNIKTEGYRSRRTVHVTFAKDLTEKMCESKR